MPHICFLLLTWSVGGIVNRQVVELSDKLPGERLLGPVGDLAVVDDKYAYVLFEAHSVHEHNEETGGPELRVFDVSRPDAIQPLRTIPLPCSGDRGLPTTVLGKGCALKLDTAADPSNPTLSSTYVAEDRETLFLTVSEGIAFGVHKANKWVYDLVAVDLNASPPDVTITVRNWLDEPGIAGVKVGRWLYIVSKGKFLVADTAAPTLEAVGTAYLPEEPACRQLVASENGGVVNVGTWSGVFSVEVSNPSAPVVREGVMLKGHGVRYLHDAGDERLSALIMVAVVTIDMRSGTVIAGGAVTGGVATAAFLSQGAVLRAVVGNRGLQVLEPAADSVVELGFPADEINFHLNKNVLVVLHTDRGAAGRPQLKVYDPSGTLISSVVVREPGMLHSHPDEPYVLITGEFGCGWDLTDPAAPVPGECVKFGFKAADSAFVGRNGWVMFMGVIWTVRSVSSVHKADFWGVPDLEPVAIATDGTFVFIADSFKSGALIILNILTGKLVAKHPYLSPPRGLAVSDRVLYVVTNQRLRLYDATDPTMLVETGSVAVKEGGGEVLVPPNAGTVLVRTSGHFTVFDVSDRTAPKPQGIFGSFAETRASYSGDGSLVYSNSKGRAYAFPVSALNRYLGVSPFPHQGMAPYTVALRGNYAVLFPTYTVVDVSDPRNPVIVSHNAFEPEPAGVDMDDGIAPAVLLHGRVEGLVFTGDVNGMKVYNLTSEGKVVGLTIFHAGNVHAISLIPGRADTLLVASDSKVRQVAVNDPRKPTFVLTVQDSYAAAVASFDGFVFAAGVSSLRVLDTTVVGTPQLANNLKKFPLVGRLIGVKRGQRNYIYAMVQDKLVVLDVTDPREPVDMSELVLPGVYAVKYAEDYLLATGKQVLYLVDVSDDNDPHIAYRLSVPEELRDFDIRAGVVYAASAWGGLRVFQVLSLRPRYTTAPSTEVPDTPRTPVPATQTQPPRPCMGQELEFVSPRDDSSPTAATYAVILLSTVFIACAALRLGFCLGYRQAIRAGLKPEVPSEVGEEANGLSEPLVPGTRYRSSTNDEVNSTKQGSSEFVVPDTRYLRSVGVV